MATGQTSFIMRDGLSEFVRASTHSTTAERGEVIQTLWSGYGEIVRYHCEGSSNTSVILKHVRPPNELDHPRGWNTNLSHERKVRSYVVEAAWYQNWSERCGSDCRVPRCLAMSTVGDEQAILMEDLDSSGYPVRFDALDWDSVKVCLKWLANFHATFLGETPSDLWQTGTYWHLATRPDELEAMTDKRLKGAAGTIDSVLEKCKYKTFVHGDAKVANFCFSRDGQRVAAVDFQYVGGGCGMKDVVYFLGSCMRESQCANLETKALDFYFGALKDAILSKGKDVNYLDVEREWRAMYAVAWTDFYRFLIGWMPTHWKVNAYSKKLSEQVLSELGL